MVKVESMSTFAAKNVLTIIEEAAIVDSSTNWFTLRGILKKNESISERAVGALASQLLSALEHIHSLNIVHGGINLDNIICSTRNIERRNAEFKLIHFDNSRVVPTKKLPVSSSKDLRSPFYSPELAE